MRVRRLALAGVLAVLCACVPAQAELSKEGALIATFDGDLSPTTLPRKVAIPVSVRVAGNVRSARGDGAVPQLRTIVVAINRQGELYDRGLPVCEPSTIQPATEALARQACGESIVGSGHVTVQVHVPGQPPFSVHAKLLAFNGPRRDGRRLIVAQAYSPNPPGAFILIFTVTKTRGLFGTVLSTSLPRSAWSWAYLTHFDMTLHRTYVYRGVRRSYVSAACGAPSGFRTAVFPFARATYGFADGRRLTMPIARSCRVSD